MNITFFSNDTVIGRIFEEVSSARQAGQLGKSVELTQAEYDQLLEETGAPVIQTIFDLEVIVDGSPVPNPLETLFAQAEADSAKEQQPNLIN